MPKQGEIDYVKNLQPDEVEHALGKPFSDPACGQHFLNLGVVFSLLPAPPARVLDVGVGTGWTSVFLARRGYDVVGVDLAPDMIALAEQHRPANVAVTFQVCDYERLFFRDEFDACLFYDALHHAEDELEALAGAHRALRNGGVCLTVEPGKGHGASAAPTVARFGVTEKEMHPAKIMALARRIGFREAHVYPRPESIAVLGEPSQENAITRYARALVCHLAKGIVGPGRQRRHWLENSHIVRLRK
jgi:SAM-dependent methyltransferase